MPEKSVKGVVIFDGDGTPKDREDTGGGAPLAWEHIGLRQQKQVLFLSPMLSYRTRHSSASVTRIITTPSMYSREDGVFQRQYLRVRLKIHE